MLAEKLSDAGTTAMYYHADMEPGSRAAAHSGWSEGHVKVTGVLLCWVAALVTTHTMARAGLMGMHALSSGNHQGLTEGVHAEGRADCVMVGCVAAGSSMPSWLVVRSCQVSATQQQPNIKRPWHACCLFLCPRSWWRPLPLVWASTSPMCGLSSTPACPSLWRTCTRRVAGQAGTCSPPGACCTTGKP